MLLDALGSRRIDACAINEHRLLGDVIEEVGDDSSWEGRWTFLRTCTGVTTGEGYRGGVGLLLSPAASRRWRAHDRVASLASSWALSAELPLPDGTVVTLISYRWPTGERSAARQEVREAAMQATHALLESASRDHPVLLLGDANGCPGGRVVPGTTGLHGQGPLTPGGEELVEFATGHSLRLMGTYFPKPADRGATWYSTPHRTWYTLDHALTRSRDACMITDVEPKVLPECDSDHRCVVVTVNPRRGQGGHVRRGLRAAQRARAAARHNVSRLKDEAKAAAFATAVTDAADVPPATDPSSLGAVEQALVAALRAAADEVLGPASSTRRRLGWQVDHADTMKRMAAARRQLAARRDLSSAEYKEARRQLSSAQRRELRQLVAQWWDDRLAVLHSGRGMPGRGAIEAAEREAGLDRQPKGRAATELYARWHGTLRSRGSP